MKRASLLALSLFATGSCVGTRPTTDADLAATIAGIKAVDSHAHPMRYVAAGAPADSEFDALPLDGIPPFPVPAALVGTHPAWREAQRTLYGVTGNDTGAAWHRTLEQARARLMAQHGNKFPTWALDQASIDVMLSNRITMGAGLTPPRFRWVSFADALMLPLDNGGEAARTPDVKALYPLETRLLRRYLKDLGLARIPATLDQYEKDVVSVTLQRQKAAGAVATKFEAAYLRSLDFGEDSPELARAVYNKFAAGGVPTRTDYKALQDHLFRVIARACARLGLAIQIHSTDIAGGYYDATAAAPHNLESAFNDTTLRKATFIIVHGGWPRVGETMSMIGKPNVYADISMMDMVAEPAALAQTLRMWLHEYPDKVLFGTDAFDGGADQAWEQVALVASRAARHALTLALGGMVRDGEITRERARTLARMVLRDNALAAYKLESK